MKCRAPIVYREQSGVLCGERPVIHTGMLHFRHQGESVQSVSDIVNLFNTHFSTISGTTVSSYCNPQSNLPCNQAQIHSPISSLYFYPVNQFEIEQAILSLKSKNSSGVDEISSFLIKQIYKVLLDPLVYLFNNSLSSSHHLQNLKDSTYF